MPQGYGDNLPGDVGVRITLKIGEMTSGTHAMQFVSILVYIITNLV